MSDKMKSFFTEMAKESGAFDGIKEMMGMFSPQDTKAVKQLETLWSCTEMVEKYHHQVFTKEYIPNIDKLTSFKGEDMSIWKNRYYKELVETDIICDNKFYPGGDRNKNYGVGDDGQFFRDEYNNLRYQLYKKIYEIYAPALNAMSAANPLHKAVMDCITMITPYLDTFQRNTSTRNNLITFKEPDNSRWKKFYFPLLVESTLLDDYTYVDRMMLRRSYGIGDDSIASGPDLQHFAVECYRFLLLPIHCMERLAVLK